MSNCYFTVCEYGFKSYVLKRIFILGIRHDKSLKYDYNTPMKLMVKL